MSRAKFRLLAHRLQQCEAVDNSINPKLLHETWNVFRGIDPENGDDVTGAMLVALVLYDEEMFRPLLDEAELSLLSEIAQKAFNRYQTKTNPPRAAGKLLQAAMNRKEST
jgi:hypothetical protein